MSLGERVVQLQRLRRRLLRPDQPVSHVHETIGSGDKVGVGQSRVRLRVIGVHTDCFLEQLQRFQDWHLFPPVPEGASLQVEHVSINALSVLPSWSLYGDQLDSQSPCYLL